MQFFFEVLLGGLLSGVMYALVALGYVLIYKASGVFNYAQGAMVFIAALTTVGLTEHGLSLWLAVPATMIVMIGRPAHCDDTTSKWAAEQIGGRRVALSEREKATLFIVLPACAR